MGVEAVYSQKSKRTDRTFVGELPGGAERRIVAEVAIQLRISPRFSDDGAPEGTCDRAISVHWDDPDIQLDEEGEHELDIKDEFVRAFRDDGDR